MVIWTPAYVTRKANDARKRYLCADGPFRGTYLWLGTRSTAVLRFGQWHGRYVADERNSEIIDWQPIR